MGARGGPIDAGPVKPWMTQEMLRWTLGSAAYKPHRVYRQWADAYMDCLTSVHMDAAGARLREVRDAAAAR